MINLEKCPLCLNGSAEYHESMSKYYGEVVCPDCGLSLTDNITGGSAVERWNNRSEIKEAESSTLNNEQNVPCQACKHNGELGYCEQCTYHYGSSFEPINQK